MWNRNPMSPPPNPYYSPSRSTRILCIAGFIASWLLVIFCIYFGAVHSRSPNLFIYLDEPIYVDLVILAQNIIITICNESLGFIHSTSLKWALQREGRLDFNSNLRVFSRSRIFGPNAWYSVAVVLFGMISAYAASSLTLIPFFNDEEGPHKVGFRISGSAFMGLGIVMALQASIATWALFSPSKIPTWSSDFLDTAAAATLLDPELKSRPSQTIPEVPPPNRQPSAYSGNKEIRHTIWALWFCVLLSLIWFLSLLALIIHSENASSSQHHGITSRKTNQQSSYPGEIPKTRYPLTSSFCSVLMAWRFKGEMPVAFGRLQIFVDEIQVWLEKGERLIWWLRDIEGAEVSALADRDSGITLLNGSEVYEKLKDAVTVWVRDVPEDSATPGPPEESQSTHTVAYFHANWSPQHWLL
ncbi:uncharacterized protein PAC_09035 [Phialocephala subalpina]|uniref:Uncharacterized protein n=1 Tax=Phialocephala subalpina TaxID=576137 RepID=A0A1L7X292_9HELO|nr:uncharacterized protein PAC_09035 [Phialocephala subalpina]